MTLKLSYLNLGVSDLAESERFYRDALGLPVERSQDGVVVHWPDLLLEFIETPPSTRGKFHFGFEVERPADVDEWMQRLRSQGVRVIAGPASHNGTYQVFLLDPDQYEIKIYSKSLGDRA